jgi:hypothetical protein
MKSQRIVLGVFKALLLLTIVIAGFGQAVLQLWNLLMPEIFGLHAISFWQAVGLMALSWILFGGLRGFGMMRGGRRHGGGHWRRRMEERWEGMTPAEREEFRKGVQGRCGGPGTPATEPTV